MANTEYVNENRLTSKAHAQRKRAFWIGLPIVVLICLIFSSVWQLCLFFTTAFLMIIVSNVGLISLAGAAGEDFTLKLLSSLPDSYTILNQIYVPNSKSKTGYVELDFVVVGPNGVFVIEVKNNNSKIVGNENDKDWIVRKVGRGGTPYTSSMRNPIKQLKSQIWSLGNFMKDQGQKAWIEGIVFLSNQDSEFEFNGDPSVPVLHKTGLTDYILDYRPRRFIENQDKIVQDLVEIQKRWSKQEG